jgi:hypothetical protein
MAKTKTATIAGLAGMIQRTMASIEDIKECRAEVNQKI